MRLPAGAGLVYLAFGIGQLAQDPKKENVFALVVMIGSMTEALSARPTRIASP